MSIKIDDYYSHDIICNEELGKMKDIFDGMSMMQHRLESREASEELKAFSSEQFEAIRKSALYILNNIRDISDTETEISDLVKDYIVTKQAFRRSRVPLFGKSKELDHVYKLHDRLNVLLEKSADVQKRRVALVDNRIRLKDSFFKLVRNIELMAGFSLTVDERHVLVGPSTHAATAVEHTVEQAVSANATPKAPSASRSRKRTQAS
jgi:hypothetical protein